MTVPSDNADELQAIYDGMVDGLLIADVQSKRFVKANAAICQMLGYSQEEILALTVKDIHPAEDVPAALERFHAQAERRIRVNEDVRIRRKDGSIFFADITGRPITYKGRPSLIKFIRDITERKKIEAAAHESELRTDAWADCGGSEAAAPSVFDLAWTSP